MRLLEIASNETTEDDPVALANKESELIHLPGEENAVSSTQNTHQQWQLPEVVQTLFGAFRVPGFCMQNHPYSSQEMLLDDESADPSNNVSGYQVLNDDDEVSHVNDGHYVIPEAELIDSTQIELESRLAELHKVYMEWAWSNLKKNGFWLVVLALMTYFIWTMPDE